MIKKSKKAKGKSLNTQVLQKVPENHYNDLVGNMTYKDLKKECIKRGMDFIEVVKCDFHKLNSWLYSNFNNKIDNTLLDKFDDFLDRELKSQGLNNLIHPSLRLGYIGEKDTEENTIRLKKIKPEKKPKEKREKTEEGLFKGTKKALTFQCANEGLSLEDTITKVMEQFDDASDKSIKIWYKKAKRNAKNSL